MKVYITPGPSQVTPDNGIGRVVLAQLKYLPAYGVQFVDNIDQADLTICHAAAAQLKRVDMLCCHGLYFDDVPHTKYDRWHLEVNTRIARAARQAKVITVPSPWVATPFLRDMRVTPAVIPHGIEPGEWQPGENQGYILWNKGRADDVCDPAPAWQLAKQGIEVVSTFAPAGAASFPNFKITGTLPAAKMKPIIQNAGIYLATTIETFGIGTIEAMAAGVPILGYDWGGTGDIVKHMETGYLVNPRAGIQALVEGYYWLLDNRAQISANCIEAAKAYTWERPIAMYYEALVDSSTPDEQDTAVVIPCYNYGNWVGEAIDSVLAQSKPANEIIVVDDGSSDNSVEVIKRYEAAGKVKAIYQKNQGVAAARNNGIRASNSPFIICLDADDRLHPHYIRTLAPALAADRSLGIVYGGLQFINPDGKLGGKPAWPIEFDWNIQAKNTVPPSNCIPSGAMFRRSMWARAGGYRQRYAPGEDAELWTRGISLGYDAKRVTDEGIFHYRGHDGSASRTKKYKSIADDKPWMNDQKYPLAVPGRDPRHVLSYALPLVSVIIPVGPGHTGYVADAIESVVAQNFRLWECIVIDDTIQDDKSEFTGGALSMYPFVRYIPNLTGTHGAGRARNLGIKAAKAPLLLFLDSDDYLQPHAIATLLQHFTQTKGERYIYSDWWLDDGSLAERHSQDYDQARWEMQHPVTCLVAKEDALAVKGFDEDLPWAEDHDFYLKLAILGRCGSRIPEALLTYRVKLGKRRIAQNTQGESVVKILEKRYKQYYDGGLKMATCCGGGQAADILLQAKSALGMAAASPETAVTVASNRLEYTGSNMGAISFTVNGRTYRGGINPVDRYTDADSRDIEKLIALGCWKRVERPSAPPAIVADPVPAQQAVASQAPAVQQQVAKQAPKPAPVQAAPAARAAVAEKTAPSKPAAAPQPKTRIAKSGKK